jgi:TonB family protein
VAGIWLTDDPAVNSLIETREKIRTVFIDYSKMRPGLRRTPPLRSGEFVFIRLLLLLTLFPAFYLTALGQTGEHSASLAILDFGDSAIGRLASEKLIANLKQETTLSLVDPDMVRTAARGAGYTRSFNMSLGEARNLGAVLGCEFFVLGDSQTIRRSPSSGSSYFDSYASMFLISARTGRLVSWERPNFRASTPAEAEKQLLMELSSRSTLDWFNRSIQRAQKDEREERALIIDRQTPVIEAAPDSEEFAEAQGLRMPRPYRRLVPLYPESAADAEAEGMVDVLVDIDSEGEVTRVQVARWAGFGLDESTINTVRQLHFFPAMRKGVAIPIRVLLRYNFRKPVK